MQLTLTNSRLRELIPNIIHEVKGETPLLDKMTPWLETARDWLEENVIGPDFDPSGRLLPIVEKIIVYKAFALAVPSLDVVLSPAGFAVINTDGRAPASKERVERLLASLDTAVDSNLTVLVARLHDYDDWAGSTIGRWWMSTFLSTLDDAFRFRGQNSLLDSFRLMRSHALRFEREVEELYLGSILATLRDDRSPDSDFRLLVSMIRQAELRYISFHMRDQKSRCPDDHEVWHLIRPVVERLRYYPALYDRWLTEMGDKFRPQQFKNDIKGGFYF